MKLTMHYLWIATACCWLGFPQSGYTAEYAKDIAPLWKRSCVACHNSKKPEGGLNLESSALLLKGSDSGPTLIAGKSGESELVLRLLATDDSAMPPRDNSAGAKPLTPAEIELVKQWIDAGAMPGEDAAPMAITWQPMPGSIRPVYAVDWSADGQFVAAGRGNQVVMYRWPLLASPADAFALVDPEIVAKTGNPSAHLDLVQSLAFSPDGQYLATGGYRSVKLWRREYAPSSWVGLNSSSGLVEAAPSGKYLAVSRADKTIDIVDVAGPKVIVTLPAAAETISAIAWSHDAAYLMVADQSKQLTRWELPPLAAPAGKKPTALTVGVGTAVTALAALDAQRVAVVSGDGELSIWAVEKANAEAAPALVKKELPEPVKNVVGVAAIAGTPPRLVAAQADGQFIALHAEELKKLSTWKSPAPVVRLAASASSAQLASLGADGQIRLWNLADGKEVKAIAPVTAAMRATAQSEKAVARQKAEVERLTAAVKDLEAASQKEQEVVKKVSEEREKAAAAVTAKTAEIDANASAIKESEKGIETAKQMIAEQMKRIEQLTADIEAKKKKDPDLVAAQKTAMEGLQKQDQALAAAKESATRAAATIPAQQSKIEAGKQKLVSLETSSASVLEVQKAKQAEPPVAFHFDESGNSLVVGRQQGSITLIDVAAGRVSSELKSTAPLTQALMLDNRVLSASPQVPLTAWTGQTQWKLERVIGSETDPKSVLSDRVTALAFSPDNAMLAIGSGPASRFGDVKLFRMSDGGLEKDFGEVHSDTVLDIAFSPDGEQLATCGADKLIRVFELASGKQRLSLEGHTHHVLSIAWQDNGRVLASAGADAAVKFWDTITGEQQRTVTGFNKEITSIAFVGQSSQLLAAAADNSLRLVESTNGKTERSFSGANSPLFALCVSADGKQVLAGGQDGRLAIWAIENAKSEKQLD